MTVPTGHGFIRKPYTDDECRFCGQGKMDHPFLNVMDAFVPSSEDGLTLIDELREAKEKLCTENERLQRDLAWSQTEGAKDRAENDRLKHVAEHWRLRGEYAKQHWAPLKTENNKLMKLLEECFHLIPTNTSLHNRVKWVLKENE